MKNNFGFNLIELLITLSIIAILSVMVIPSYSNHLIRAHRIEAEITLEKLAAALEQYAITNNTYENATLDKLKIISPRAYQLEIASATNTNFVVLAHPIATQEKNDTECATLSLNSKGEKSITGAGSVQECW